MPLAIVAVLILLMKIGEIGPVATWWWGWVLLPFVVLFIWWEWLAEAIGWDKKQAAKRMEAAEKEAQETKRKNRGF